MRLLHVAAVALVAAAPLPSCSKERANRPVYEPAVTKPSVEQILEADFWGAIGAPDTTYRMFRDRLVLRGPSIIPFLEERVRQSRIWEEETMAWILLERVKKKAVVEAILAHEPKLEYIRNPLTRQMTRSKALAEKCREVPMLLVEQVWKPALAEDWENPQVELKWGPLRARSSDVRIYAAYALGWLRERRAVPVLVDIICKSQDQHFVPASPFLYSACFALGQIGDPRAVPALVRTAVLYNDPLALGALKTCITDHEGIAFFARFINENTSGNRREHFERIAAEIEDSLKKQ